MCNAARAELLLPHAPDIPAQGSPLDYWTHEAETTLWVMFGDRYQELTTGHDSTERHQRAVAGLACAMVAAMDMPPDDHRLGVALITAARFHDIGKGRPEIQDIIDLPRKFTPAETSTMGLHAGWSAEDFEAFAEEKLQDPSLQADSILFRMVKIMIQRHHDYGGRQRLSGLSVDPIKLRNVIAVLQTIDNVEDILTPEGRAYRLDRLVGEGLAVRQSRLGSNDVLRPNTDKIAEHIRDKVGIDSLGRLTQGVVTMRDLVALGVGLMCDSEPEPVLHTTSRGSTTTRHIVPSQVPRLGWQS